MTTSTGIELVWVPPGEFLMGSTAKERLWAVGPEGNQDPAYRFESGEPKRTIIKNGFWMARTEVTVGQWQKFVDAGYVTEAEKHGSATAPDLKTGKMGTVQGASWRNPNFGFPPKENHPVCCISWNDAVAFCQWLTEAEKKAGKLPTGLVYRLPSEAEWEYACRGGKEGTKFWWGNTMDQGKGRLNASGVIWGDSYKYASPVDAFGSRGRNGFGLADMLGNVYEWCLDDFDPETAHAEPYKGKTTDRVLRGGSWYEFRPSNLRCAHRFRWPSSYANAKGGFRVCAGVAW
jgi:formylglycine-generating enzyme required for sulfatase activity